MQPEWCKEACGYEYPCPKKYWLECAPLIIRQIYETTDKVSLYKRDIREWFHIKRRGEL